MCHSTTNNYVSQKFLCMKMIQHMKIKQTTVYHQFHRSIHQAGTSLRPVNQNNKLPFITIFILLEIMKKMINLAVLLVKDIMHLYSDFAVNRVIIACHWFSIVIIPSGTMVTPFTIVKKKRNIQMIIVIIRDIFSRSLLQFSSICISIEY